MKIIPENQRTEGSYGREWVDKLAQKLFLGIDLGGTKIAAGLVTLQGQIVHKGRRWTKGEEGPQKVLERIFLLVEDLLQEAKVEKDQIAGVGLGVPGIVDWRRGLIRELTNLPGWQEVNAGEIFAARFGWPVALDNDANAAALGEYLFGSGRGADPMFYLTVSTGIGGGLILDGSLVRGAGGVAGEVGHLVLDPQGRLCRCGNRGCWETISSGTAIAREARRRLDQGEKSLVKELAGDGTLKAEHVFKAQELGDPMAQEIIQRAMFYLGLGVANVANTLNPARIVIGGGVAQAGEALFGPVRQLVKRLGFGPAAQTEIVPAALGEEAGIVGAAALAMASQNGEA